MYEQGFSAAFIASYSNCITSKVSRYKLEVLDDYCIVIKIVAVFNEETKNANKQHIRQLSVYLKASIML